jgi:hypothetical protein
MTELKIMTFGFIFLVRPFSIIQQKVVLYLSDFFKQNGERSPLK